MSFPGVSLRSVDWVKAAGKRGLVFCRWLLAQHTVRKVVLVGYILITTVAPLYRPYTAEAATINHRSTASANNNAATSLTINKPTGTASGDVLVLIIAVDAQNQTGFSLSSDWRLILHSNNGSDVTVNSYYKVAGNSEPADYTVSWAGSTRAAGSISAYYNVDKITPVEVIGTNSTANGNSITVTGITTLTNNSVVLAVLGGSNNGATSFGTPTGMTQRDQTNSTTGASDVTAAIFDVTQGTAGASGNKTSTAGGGIPKAGHLFALRPAIDSPTLMLYWDGGTPPAGWSVVTSYDGLFPRGEAVSNFGVVNKGSVHVPTISSMTVGGPSTNTSNGIGASDVSSTGHGHGVAPSQPTVGAASNSDQPLHRTMRLIRYDAGIPPFIPAGGIAMFDDTGIPAGWTAQTARHNKMIKINSTDTSCSTADCGSDTHTHSLTGFGSLNAATGTAQRQTLFATGGVSAANGHTHAAPGNTNTTGVSQLPPYVQPLLAKANSDTVAIPAGLLGMFDATPGSGWVVRSNTGGEFYQQFLRASATFNGTSLGALTHSHAAHNAVSGTPSATLNGWTGTTGNVAGGGHTHTYTVNFTANDENIPQYFNTVIAEKINFILSDYRWYEDSDAEDVTDPWGRIDVAQNASIATVPPRNDPPAQTAELRLRVKITISGEDLPPNDISFRLQYKMGTDATCTTGSWADVGVSGSGTIWRFANSSVSDGEPLSNSRLSPASSVLQTYNKSNPTADNPSGAAVTQGMEYDFHFEHNGANTGTVYSFRLIESGGAVLAEYAVCPTLATRAGTDQQMRHGNVFESETERGFVWAD